MGFSLGGLVSGFVEEAHKEHGEKIQDDTLKLKQDEQKDKHELTGAHVKYYNSLADKAGKNGELNALQVQRMELAKNQDRRAEEMHRARLDKLNPPAIGDDGAGDAATNNLYGGAPGRMVPAQPAAATPGIGGATRPWPTAPAPAAPGAAIGPGDMGAADEDDDDGDEEAAEEPQRFAEGGTVQPDPQAGAPGPAIGGPAPAPAPAAPQATPAAAPPQAAPAQQNGGWKNAFGFSAADTLRDWGKADVNHRDVLGGGTSADEEKLEAIPTSKTKRTKADKTDVNPVAFGLASIQQAWNAPGGGSGAVDGGVSNLQSKLRANEGALSLEEFHAAANAIDPKHELNSGARSIAVMDKITKHYLQAGDVKSAQKVAQGVIMLGKQESEKMGALAADAIRKGDMKSAVDFFSRAYDWSPDGKELKAFIGPDGQAHAKTIDAEGKEQDLGAFGPQQLFKLALNERSGAGYMQRLAGVAYDPTGEKAAKAAAQKAAADAKAQRVNVPKLVDRAKAAENISNEMAATATVKDKPVPKYKGLADLPPDVRETYASVASQIHGTNDMDAATSIRAVDELTSAEGKPPKMTANKNGGATAILADGSQVTLSPNALAKIGLLRSKADEINKAKIAKGEEDKKTEDKRKELLDKQKKQIEERRGGPRPGRLQLNKVSPNLGGDD